MRTVPFRNDVLPRLLLPLLAGFALPAFALTLEPYGFLRANLSASTRAVDSFGNSNLSAPVRALPSDDTARSSFQLSQTRLGVRINDKEKVSGQLELDFIDFAKATPVTKAVPRLRIAAIRYHIDDRQEFEIGQDWDTFSPGKPFTYNYVGLFFNAGNAGFMRPQAKYKLDHGTLHLEGALGLAMSSNSTATDADTEKNLIPSAAMQVAYRPSPTTSAGLSGIVGRLRFGGAYTTFYGLDLFAETSPWEGGALHAALYYGQNLGNTGALTLATVTGADARHEAGGYFTLEQHLGTSWKIVGGLGAAYVFEDAGAAALTGTALHPRDNAKASVALAWVATKGLDLFAENAVYSTRYMSAGAETRVTANALDIGAVYAF